jgi:hypothetical protein
VAKKTNNGKSFTPVANEANGKSKSEFESLFEFREIVDNVMTQRQQLISRYFDPRRKIEDECGYPDLRTVTPQHYKDLYDGDPIGGRVVELMPLESWQVTPSVFEDEDPDVETEFEAAWLEIGKNLRGRSWYQDEEGNAVWEWLIRADIDCGIGHFGILLIGIDDGKPLSEPADGVEQAMLKAKAPVAKKGTKLLYLRSFDESQITVQQWDTDPKSLRYGQPIMYSVTLWNPESTMASSSMPPTGTFSVHWTRAIHLTSGEGSNEVVGLPRLQSVLYPVLDIRKVAGGSAEMYWKGAFPGISIETHPQLGGDVKINKAIIRTQMEQYFNGLQRYLGLMGVSAKTLSPMVVDPTAQIKVQLERICIRKACPVRVFIGSERGELASSQDDSAWNDRLRQQQTRRNTPRIICPTINRLIMMGVLPEPKGYSTIWPDLESLSDMDQAEIAVKRTGALAQFVQSGSESAMSLADFFTRILNMGIEEAQSIIEAVERRIKEEDSGGSPLLSMASGMTGMIELFKLYSAGGMSRETLKQQIMLFFKVDAAKADAIISKEELKKSIQPPQAIPGNPEPSPEESSESEDEVDETEDEVEVPAEDEEEEVANQALVSNNGKAKTKAKVSKLSKADKKAASKSKTAQPKTRKTKAK